MKKQHRLRSLLAHLAPPAAFVVAASVHAAPVVTLQQFDPACGQPQHNCREAFQKAFAAEAKTGGTVLLPAGTFQIDFPEVAQDVRSAPALQPESLVQVPAGVTIQGHLNASRNPDSVIEWSITSIPVFIFANASHSGMKNLHLRFTGATPQQFPYGDIALLRALGYKPTFPHAGQMQGGNYEMFSFAYLFNSDDCSFDNLTFDSAVHDNAHVYGLGINAKGKGVVVNGGAGGLSETAVGNSFTNLRFFDAVMPMLIGAQENLVVNSISSDRRGSTMNIAPGHLIYFTAGGLFEANGAVQHIWNKHITVSNLSEGPDTYSDIHSGATLSLKYIEGGTFQHIHSQNPDGLIQPFYNTKSLTLEDLTWTSYRDMCAVGAPTCNIPPLESVPPLDPSDQPNSNLTLRSLIFTSTVQPIGVEFEGNNITVDGLTIETSPDFRQGQANTNAVLSVKNASHVTITNYTYIPLVTSADPRHRYNTPYTCWGQCTDVHVDVRIQWPHAVPLPPQGTYVITPAIQVKNSANTNNTVRTRIEPR